MEKLTKKVTHLLCKFSNGPKYVAACKWVVQPVTSEWIFECVKQVSSLFMGHWDLKCMLVLTNLILLVCLSVSSIVRMV